MTSMTSISQELSEALAVGDSDAAKRLTEEALDKGIDPLDLVQSVVIPTLTEVGRRFEQLEIFLPELIAAGMAGKVVSGAVENALARVGNEMNPLGVVVIGTVKGDIHDIGKNIVATLLTAHGYKVYDLGKDVSAATFVEAAYEYQADVIAASALMSITRAGCRDVADLLRELNITGKYHYIVGGGSLDQAYADEIGAHGYAATAAGAVELVQTVMDGRRLA